MSKNLELKKQVVSDIVKKFQDAQSVIVVKYSGLTVEQVTGLRAQFRANGVEYCVLKNTLVRRALKELNIEGLDEVLNGPSAFAFGMNDPVSPAKIINDFIVKKKSEAIEIKAGQLGNEPWPKCPAAKCCWPAWSAACRAASPALCACWMQSPRKTPRPLPKPDRLPIPYAS